MSATLIGAFVALVGGALVGGLFAALFAGGVSFDEPHAASAVPTPTAPTPSSTARRVVARSSRSVISRCPSVKHQGGGYARPAGPVRRLPPAETLAGAHRAIIVRRSLGSPTRPSRSPPIMKLVARS